MYVGTRREQGGISDRVNRSSDEVDQTYRGQREEGNEGSDGESHFDEV
jgi:hypothetical protein